MRHLLLRMSLSIHHCVFWHCSRTIGLERQMAASNRRAQHGVSQLEAAQDIARKLWHDDLRLVRSVQHTGNNHRQLRSLLSKVVNAHPLGDISLATWFVFLAFLYDLGLPFFYACAANLVVASVLRQIIRARRPFEFDRRIVALADRYQFSYGLPSLESYMAVIVCGYIIAKVDSALLAVLLVSLVAFVGLTRVYAGSRFVHQILGSWALGILGLHVTLGYVNRLSQRRVHANVHACVMVALALGFLAYMAYYAELNESYLLNVPKEEYTRVLKMILDQDVVQTGGNDGAADFEMGMEADGAGVLRRRKGRTAQRKDSFYFLEKTIADREARAQGAFAPGEEELMLPQRPDLGASLDGL